MCPTGAQQTITLAMHREKKQFHSHSCVGFAELKGVKKTTESYFCPFGKDN